MTEARQPPYDFIFGKLCRLLMANDLEMHTPRKGDTYICRRPAWKRRHPLVRRALEEGQG